jgi:hypothetical protein
MGPKNPLLIYLAMLFVFQSASAAVWYVDKDNTSGTEDGTSWATAYPTIQPAIDAASADGGGEVWVAEGAYDETRVSPFHEPVVDTGSLVLKSGVDLYGGFIGLGAEGNETAREERDWESNLTTIDGSEQEKSRLL